MKAMFWKHRFTFLLIVPILFLVFLWFRNGLVHGGGDEELLFVNAKRALAISSSTWLDKSTGVAILYWLARLSFVAIVYLFNSVLAVPNVILQGLTIFILLVTGAISLYFLTRTLFDSHKSRDLIGFVTSLFYIFNPYSMSQVWGRGQYAQFFSFALLPLSLLIFIHGAKKRNYFYAFLFAFVTVLFSTSYNFVTFIATQWFMILMYSVNEAVFQKKYRYRFFILSYFFLSLFLWVVVNCWWFLPLVVKGGSILSSDLNNPNENIGTLIGVSQSYPFPIIIRLLQSFYFFSPSGYGAVYSIIRFQLMSFIPLLFLGIGTITALSKKRNSGAVFIILTFFVGLAVSLGANMPFGTIFVWVFQHVATLQAFRNPYEKFGLVYMLGYSQLVGLGAVVLYKFLMKRIKKYKFIAPLIFVGVFLTWNYFLWPMWTGKIIENPDGKIGVSVPKYYYEFEKWLVKNNDGYRVMMTPLWGGDGAFYDWNGRLYQGVDPILFLVDAELISNIGNNPFYVPFAQNIRKYVEQINIHPALELLRVKYLVNRNDAIKISGNEKQQYKAISKTIYPPSPFDIDSVCENQHVIVPKKTQATIHCTLPDGQSNWKNVRYFNLSVSTNEPSYVEVVMHDKKDTIVGWDGRGDTDYLAGRTKRTVIFPLRSPSNSNESMDYSQIKIIEVYAHPIHDFGGSVGEITLEKIGLNAGEKVNIDEFTFFKSIGKLDIYKPNSLVTPPEFGTLAKVIIVSDYKDLFLKAIESRDKLDAVGFAIGAQNFSKLNQVKESSSKVSVVSRISDTRFWMKVIPDKSTNILLSKTFYSEWKLIPGIDKSLLDGSFIHNLMLLKKPTVSEKQHLVANGYANLWIVNGNESRYAVVFMPQIVTDIGFQITITSLAIMGCAVLIWFGVRLYKKKRN